MSINDLLTDMEAVALKCATEAGALAYCGRHDVHYLVDDLDKDRHAYARLTLRTRGEDREVVKEHLDALKHLLETAADEECPGCADDREG